MDVHPRGRSLNGKIEDDPRDLVTGGAGLIRSHLADALEGTGASVRVLDDLSSGRRENLAASAKAIDFVVGDVRDVETCRRARRGSEIVSISTSSAQGRPGTAA